MPNVQTFTPLPLLSHYVPSPLTLVFLTKTIRRSNTHLSLSSQTFTETNFVLFNHVLLSRARERTKVTFAVPF